MSRVVDTDNFGGDYPNEKFITLPLADYLCTKIVAALNDDGEYARRYYKIVPDDYELPPVFEP